MVDALSLKVMESKYMLDNVNVDRCVECNGVGIYYYEGNWYCPKHYSLNINKSKPTGRAGMGASTIIINEGAGI